MRREKAIFTGSRLYRQAAEGSQQLLDQFSSQQYPFTDAQCSLSGGQKEIVIKESSDCEKLTNNAKTHALKISAQISPYIAIPVLLQAITDFYYGDKTNHRPYWLGTALKISLALVWKNIFVRHNALTKSLSSIKQLVAATSLFEQLQNLSEIYQTVAEGEVLLNGAGIFSMDDTITDAYVEYSKSFRRRGRIFRTVEESMRTLSLQPNEAISAIIRILQGELPSQQEAFQDTLFGEIKSNEPMEFWAGLWARLQIMLLATYFRKKVTENHFGITLFQTLGITFPKGRNNIFTQNACINLFWRNDWYSERIQGTASAINNMIVERPIARITDERDLYVTSPILIVDSLNWFVEESIMRYPDRGAVPLSESTFRNLISDPFESNVCNIFRKHTFLAAKVTQKGTWLLEEMNITLRHLKGASLPGEIDILAYHPLSREVVVIECKVLGFPFRKEKMRNLLSKIGKQDSEEFHAKLDAKVKWIKRTDIFSLIPVSHVIGMIVLDRKAPYMRKGKYNIYDFDVLEKGLEKIYGSGFTNREDTIETTKNS